MTEARFEGVTLGSAFVREFPELVRPWQARQRPAPKTVIVNRALADELGLSPEATRSLEGPEGAEFLVGTRLAQGSQPAAQLYAGHQFGAYSPILGDGRALLLGEIVDGRGGIHELHLKGSGPTPVSRGDGEAALGPMLREYLVSEAMHALGVPTTRSLAVTATGAQVMRDDFARDDVLPGAVLARTATSYLRVGTFQYARSTGDTELLARLTRFAIHRHYREFAGTEMPASDLLRAVTHAQARLIASWMLIGFVHGVMNTDNMTISGETIDYGPCAFLDRFDPAQVFSSIDQGGRYAFQNQPVIGHWNLARFAETLLPLIAGEISGGDSDAAAAVDHATSIIGEFDAAFQAHWVAGMRAKLGLDRVHDGGGSRGISEGEVAELAGLVLTDLAARRGDHTQFFRALADAARGDEALLRDVLMLDAEESLESQLTWIHRWKELGPDAAGMDLVNPVTIPRNHALDAALESATDGDLEPFMRLLKAVQYPYEARDEWVDLAVGPGPEAARFVSYCGT